MSFKTKTNPADHFTNIEYILSDKSYVTLEIINMNGQIAYTLINKKQKSGNHQALLNTSKMKQGIYLSRLTVKYQFTEKEYLNKIAVRR